MPEETSEKASEPEKIATPCIGVCSTAIGNSVCRGCKRFVHEVIAWNGYSIEEKTQIEFRLQSFLRVAVQDKLQILNEDLVRQRLHETGVRYVESRDAICLLADLLRAASRLMQRPEDFGFCVRDAYRHLALSKLREMIDEEFYQRSRAYYERHIGPLQSVSS